MTDLVPCPLCGDDNGYALKPGSTHRWWIPLCMGCGEQISECRSDPDAPYNAPLPDRWALADEAWNAAGKHAQGLRDEIARLRTQRQSLGEDFREYLYRIASQVPFEHQEWANQRGAALLAALKEPK